YKNIIINIIIHAMNNIIPSILFLFQENSDGQNLTQMSEEIEKSGSYLSGGVFLISISIWYIIYFCVVNWPKKDDNQIISASE
ncbi:hypothetical protein JXR93_12470, partial [bacterium]|nr:hypothetical protein [bacterium]